jgi:hypothetical protein
VLLALVVLTVLAAGCDQGGSFVADNRSTSDVYVRLKTAVSTDAGWAAAYEVVEIPALSRLVIALQPFAGDRVSGIEDLTESCDVIGTFFGWDQGSLFRIDDGPTATVVKEWPQDTEPRAAVVNACPVPSPSPTP